MEVTRELYNNMAEGDVDAQIDAINELIAEKPDTKKNDFLNSIPLTKTGTNTDASQTKEKGTTT